MTATNKKIPVDEPGELEALLPWHATGRLPPRDARRVDDALQRDPALARQYAVIQDEQAGTIHLNETLGAPSARAMQKLFAAIDAEPARCFELIAHGILTAGDKFGYQDESLGADRVVKVVGRTLADHRWIFDDAARRAQLVEILELFVDRGWPQARRLLYELPDLFR